MRFGLVVCVVSLCVWPRCVSAALSLFVEVLLCVGDCRVGYCVKGQVPSVFFVKVMDVV